MKNAIRTIVFGMAAMSFLCCAIAKDIIVVVPAHPDDLIPCFGASRARNASPSCGRRWRFSGPCQCPFLGGGPAHSRHSQDIGVDFTIRFGFAENSSKNLAGCDTRTSHPAIAELRKVRHGHFAPCDSLMLHLATSRYRTLPLSPVAPCDSKRPILAP